MTQEPIETGVYGITVFLSGHGGGTIRSELHHPKDGPEATAAIDALESLILAHACAGIDITSPAYLEGIETAVDAITNHGGEEPDAAKAGPPAVQLVPYLLNIDGPLLRAQRVLLPKLLLQIQQSASSISSPNDAALLHGLISLTDVIADQAHDRYGMDCLLDETDQPCECELPGYFCSGVPGILARVVNGQLAPDAKVERCDLCQRYPSDEAALEKLRELGYGRP